MNEIDATLFPCFALDFPERLYHYTTLEGLQGILSSGLLRASDVAYMNDTSEMTYSYDLCCERHSRLRPSPTTADAYLDKVSRLSTIEQALQSLAAESIFCAASFCAARDELAQWRTYGDRGGGCALVFDGPLLQSAVRRQNRLIAGPIIYDPVAQHEMVDKLIAGLAGDAATAREVGLLRRARYIAPFMKNPVFEQEREWRIGRFHYNKSRRDGDGTECEVDFRPSRGLLVPFTHLDLRVHSNSIRLPLVEVMLGPTINAGAATRSMRMYLDTHGYADAVVSQSGLPLRF